MRKHIALIDQGPAWDESKSGAEQGPAMDDHGMTMGKNFDSGILDLGGFFEGGGGMAVLDVEDFDAARAIMDADPAVVAGVLVYQLRTLHVAFTEGYDMRVDG